MELNIFLFHTTDNFVKQRRDKKQTKKKKEKEKGNQKEKKQLKLRVIKEQRIRKAK